MTNAATPAALGDERWPSSLETPTSADGELDGARYGFPGCRTIHIPASEVAEYDGRFEYWDGETGAAWVCEPTTIYHEAPSQRLAWLAKMIGAMRGSPIETFGTADLLQRDTRGQRKSILQADQMVYVHPRTNGPAGSVVEVGEDDLPDVVLEVDHTTDARRRKLGIYQRQRFPEIWVEVPEHRPASRPRSRLAGLTIHLLDPGHQDADANGYRNAGVSRAFPGWTAAEIHRALGEAEVSQETVAVLRRVGRTLGEWEGTSPDDDVFLREARRESREEGRLSGVVEGIVEGVAEGHLQGLRDNLGTMLTQKSVALSEQVEACLAAVTVEQGDAFIRAAMESRDEADFLRRARTIQRSVHK